MEKLNFIRLKGEQARTYIFPGGKIRFERVSEICVRPSGTHRLNMADGKRAIVNSGWLAILIEAKVGWTF